MSLLACYTMLEYLVSPVFSLTSRASGRLGTIYLSSSSTQSSRSRAHSLLKESKTSDARWLPSNLTRASRWVMYQCGRSQDIVVSLLGAEVCLRQSLSLWGSRRFPPTILPPLCGSGTGASLESTTFDE